MDADAGAVLEVDWTIYDGLGFSYVDGVALIANTIPSASELNLDRIEDLSVSLAPYVYRVEDGRRTAERKLPARRFDIVEGTLRVAVPEKTALPAEVEALLPERSRGREVTQVAVASRRSDMPEPAVVMDNDDKHKGETGEIIVVKNVDLLKEPVSEERLRAALASAGLEDELPAILEAHAASRAAKEAAVQAHHAMEVTP